MGSIIGRLTAVFRRSHGEKRPRSATPTATSVAVPRRSEAVPRPPALVVADGYVEAEGARFTPMARSDEFIATVPSQPRLALRLPTLEYRTVMLELLEWFDGSDYDEASPAYRAFRHSALVCAGCGWQFPGSYTASLLGMFEGRTVVGGTSGFASFGRTGKCPKCGTKDSFLLYERIDPDSIGEADLTSLAELWRDDALVWWSRAGRRSAVCDSCNGTMHATDGFLVSSSSLTCERCIVDYLDGALEKLRANPYCYGATELRRARPYRPGSELTEGGAPDDERTEHVLVLWDGARPDVDELKDLVESVAPGSTAQGMSLDRSDTSALSRGLAYWHVYSDEVAGRVTPGAWRRIRLTERAGRSGRRMVAVVAAAAPDAPEVAPAPQEWAREMLFRHVARVELELRPDLMARPTWRQLLDPEVVDFVLGIEPDPAARASGTTAATTGGMRYSFRARTFGDLSVVVSRFDVAQADQIRDQMAGGWENHIDTVLPAAGIRLGERDVAHWILGREPDDAASVTHLAYLAAEADSTALVPIDLLARPDADTL